MVDLIRRLSATATTTLPDFLVSNMNESALSHPCARLNGLGPASTFGQAEANTPDLRPRLVPARFPIPKRRAQAFKGPFGRFLFFVTKSVNGGDAETGPLVPRCSTAAGA